MSPDLFRKHVLESDELRKEIAAEMGTTVENLKTWERRHGFEEGSA